MEVYCSGKFSLELYKGGIGTEMKTPKIEWYGIWVNMLILPFSPHSSHISRKKILLLNTDEKI